MPSRKRAAPQERGHGRKRARGASPSSVRRALWPRSLGEDDVPNLPCRGPLDTELIIEQLQRCFQQARESARSLGERAMNNGVPCAQCAKDMLFVEEAAACVFNTDGKCLRCKREGEPCDPVQEWLWEDIEKLRRVMARAGHGGTQIDLTADEVAAQMRLRSKMANANVANLVIRQVRADTNGANAEALQALLLEESRVGNAHMENLETAGFTTATMVAKLNEEARGVRAAVDNTASEVRAGFARLDQRQQELQMGLSALGGRIESSMTRLGDRLQMSLAGLAGPHYPGYVGPGSQFGGYHP